MEERELTAGQALLWAMGAAMLMWVGLGVVVALRPASATDIVTVGAVEASALLLTVFFVLRVYAPERPALAALGVRPTHPGLAAVAVALGTVLHIPAESLRHFMERLVPPAETELAQRALLLSTDGWPDALALVLVVACLVPLVEELLIRGVLFAPLVRSGSASTAVAATAIAFVVLHLLQWRNAPALLLTGGVLSYLRGATGSLLPPLATHVAFNATTVLALLTGAASATQPLVVGWPITVGGWVVTLVLIAVTQWLSGRSAEAIAARAEDEA
jgi:membrane protease YdiL (CAAX protease family)